jgi:hypothetical protein
VDRSDASQAEENVMSDSNHTRGSDPSGTATPPPTDSVLAALHEAAEQYRDKYASHNLRNVELKSQLAQAHDENAALTAKLAAQERALDDLGRVVQQQRTSGEALAGALKEIHRALFTGNVYELILKTCLTLTGATRGLYVTSTGVNEPLQTRASADVGEDPAPRPSKFIDALCRLALDRNRVTKCNEVARPPEDGSGGEPFRDCIAAPVVLRGDLSGVVVVADKATGEFSDEDAHLLLSVGSHAAVAVENTRLQREVQEAYLSIVSVLAHTMAARSPQEGLLEEDVCRLAAAVAERLGLSEYERSTVYYGALLHDVGNVGVSDGVLNKPGPLLEAERNLIRTHAQIGHDLVRDIPVLDAVAGIVRHHHERFDGSGYPDGLKGEAIPIAARIVAVVDAYGAMLAPRSYRPALSPEQACEELRQGSGHQFDPHVVDIFLALLKAPRGHTAKAQLSDLPLPGLDLQHATPAGLGRN